MYPLGRSDKMKKYNNIANHMGLMAVLVNILFPILIISIILSEQGINMIAGATAFMFVIASIDFVYFYLLDQWYFTYYNDEFIIQKWLMKRKKIKFNEVKYLYFIDNIVILSEHAFNIDRANINMKAKRRIKKMLKNEICIVIEVYDKIFPKMLLEKCNNAIKIDFKVKLKVYREMFELD